MIDTERPLEDYDAQIRTEIDRARNGVADLPDSTPIVEPKTKRLSLKSKAQAKAQPRERAAAAADGERHAGTRPSCRREHNSHLAARRRGMCSCGCELAPAEPKGPS